MRGTTSFLKRFWKRQSGAKPSEIVIVLAIIGVALAGTMILLSDSISHAINGL